jgi:hypothetical protein
MDPNGAWLEKHLDEYQAGKDDMSEGIEEPGDMDKLG